MPFSPIDCQLEKFVNGVFRKLNSGARTYLAVPIEAGLA